MNATDMRPLVVHLIDELPPDGAERLIVDLMRYPDPAFRYAVGCLIRGGPLEAELRTLGVPVVVFGRRGRLDLGLIVRMARWLRRERAAVVHTHLFTADTYGRIAARLAGVPAVFATVHNVVNPWKRGLHRFIDRVLAWASTRVIACTDEVGTVLRTRDRLPARRIVVVGNGVDLQRLCAVSGAGVREEFGIEPGRVLLGVVGRLHPQKGHADLLPMLARLKAGAGPRFSCLVIGDGELRATLQAQADELGLADTVVFAGLRADVPRLLAAIDLLVMPSRWEGLPIALLEAMACGKPAVATAVGGVPDVLRDGINGALVAAGDAPAFEAALARLIADAPQRARLGVQAQADVLRTRDIACTASSYTALYRAALGMDRGAPAAGAAVAREA